MSSEDDSVGHDLSTAATSVISDAATPISSSFTGLSLSSAPSPSPRATSFASNRSHSHYPSDARYLSSYPPTPDTNRQNHSSNHNFRDSSCSTMLMTSQGQSQGNLQRPLTLDILQPPSLPFEQEQGLMHHHNSHPHYQHFPNHHQQPPPATPPSQHQQYQQQQQQQHPPQHPYQPHNQTQNQNQNQDHQHQYQHQHQTLQEDLHKEQLQIQPQHQYQQPFSSWPRQQRQRPTNTTEVLQQQSPSLSPSQSQSQPQRALQQQQQQRGPPLSLSMSSEHPSHQKDSSQPRRGRLFGWPTSTSPLTPLSAMSTNEFGHSMYMDPHQYHLHQQQQQQHYQQSHHQSKQGHNQHQLMSVSSQQSITPDHILTSDFDWFAEASDIDTPASSNANHSRATTDSGVTPPLSSASTLSGQTNNTSANQYEIFRALASTTPSSLPSAAIADMEMLSLQTESSASPHSRFGQDSVAPSGMVMKPQDTFGSENSKHERRRRSKTQKDPGAPANAFMPGPSSFGSDAKSTAGSTPRSHQSTVPSMPSPLSPILTYPDGRVQRNPTLKQEPVMEHISNTSSTAPSAVLSTPPSTSGSIPGSSSILNDLFPMPSSSQPEVVFGQHRVLSTTSQDSRGAGGGAGGGGSGMGWGGHCNTSLPSSKFAPHALGGNASGMSPLSIQSMPRREVLHREIDISPVHTNRDTTGGSIGAKVIGGNGMNTGSDQSMEPTPKLEMLNSSDSVVLSGMMLGKEKDGAECDSDSESGRPAVCPHCNKEFQSKGLLRSHVVSHSSDRPFVCWDCTDKSYKRNHDLLRHRREKHSAEGTIVPPRGSGRNQSSSGSTVREAGHERATQQLATVGQSHFSHHEMMYPGHGMMYLGSGGLSDLSSTSSGSPLDPYAGVDYSQHHHGHPSYTTHGHNVGLGLGLEMNLYPKDFLGGLNMFTPGAGGEGRPPGNTRRPSREGGVNPVLPAEATAGKRRKLSNSSQTTSKA